MAKSHCQRLDHQASLFDRDPILTSSIPVELEFGIVEENIPKLKTRHSGLIQDMLNSLVKGPLMSNEEEESAEFLMSDEDVKTSLCCSPNTQLSMTVCC